MQHYFLWCSQAISEMSAEESISDVATAALQLAQHQQLWTEMEARQETYQRALDMGEELQSQSRSNKREVCEWPQRRAVRFSSSSSPSAVVASL